MNLLTKFHGRTLSSLSITTTRIRESFIRLHSHRRRIYIVIERNVLAVTTNNPFLVFYVRINSTRRRRVPVLYVQIVIGVKK